MMGGKRMAALVLAIGAPLVLGGCYGPGYGGVSVGYGGGYYDDYYGGYGAPGYGYGYPAGYGYGWYDDFYYPGGGYYVYDRRGQRHRWTPAQRDYWRARNAQQREVRNQIGNAFNRGTIDRSRLRDPDTIAPAVREERARRRAEAGRPVRDRVRSERPAIRTERPQIARPAERTMRPSPSAGPSAGSVRGTIRERFGGRRER